MVKKNPGRRFTNLGLVFACLSWLAVPIIFGPASVALGVKGYFMGDEKRGMVTIVLGVVFAVASIMVGAYVAGLLG